MSHPIDNQYRYGIVYNLNGEIVGFNVSPDVCVPLTNNDIEKALENYILHKEIIQCGQCKYAKKADPEDSQDGYTCQFHRGSIWFSGSYCSWAERSETDDRLQR